MKSQKNQEKRVLSFRTKRETGIFMKNKCMHSAFALFAVFALISAAVLQAGVMPASAESSDLMLIPGGMPFGIKFFASGALVIGTTGIETENGLVSPAKDAGIRSRDIIIRVCGTDIESAYQMSEIIRGSGGLPVTVAFLRDGREMTAAVTPAKEFSSKEYKIGVMVRDSTAGIGTVTYIVPATSEFGGLGHGINDSETNVLFPLAKGIVVDALIRDVVKSEKNRPGELKGDFGKFETGQLYSNTDMGVFGKFGRTNKNKAEPIPAASRDEIREGEATVITTVSESGPREYKVLIEKIYDRSGKTKNFLVRVTDEKLLSLTGGIVQGMSGSPIIQNGKLIGAVTHVLVNNPERGYGIFIENMLDAAA